MTRGNQREIDRARAAARVAKNAPKEGRGGNVQVRTWESHACYDVGGVFSSSDACTPRNSLPSYRTIMQQRNESDAAALQAKLAAKAAKAAEASAGGGSVAAAAPKK